MKLEIRFLRPNYYLLRQYAANSSVKMSVARGSINHSVASYSSGVYRKPYKISACPKQAARIPGISNQCSGNDHSLATRQNADLQKEAAVWLKLHTVQT